MSTERSKDGIQEVTVTFPEHQSDIMLLNRFYLNDEDRIAGQNSHKKPFLTLVQFFTCIHKFDSSAFFCRMNKNQIASYENYGQ